MREHTNEYHTHEELKNAIEEERVHHVQHMACMLGELHSLYQVAHTSPEDVAACIDALARDVADSMTYMQMGMQPSALRKSKAPIEGRGITVQEAAHQAAARRKPLVIDEEA